MKKYFILFLVSTLFTIGAAKSLDLEVGQPDQMNLDPYRAAYKDESVVFNWLIQESIQIIDESKLKMNASLAEIADVLDEESIKEITTTVDFETWELKFGKDFSTALSAQQMKGMELNKRLQAPFFDPADLKIFGLKRLDRFRSLIDKMAFRTFHRNADQVSSESAPMAFIGFAAEDDLDYEWPLRKFGDGNGVYLNVTTKGLQMTNLVKVLSERLEILAGLGKIDKQWAQRMSNGAKRFILGFGLHEVYHSFQFFTVPVRNNSQPEFKDSMVGGMFNDIKASDFPALDYKTMSYTEFLEKAYEQANKEIDVLRGLTDSKPMSSDRQKALQSFKTLFNYSGNMSTWLSMTSDDLWMKKLAPFIEKNKSILWDSIAKVQVYEIEGFGFNRTLIKGHERDLREVGYLIHLLRIADSSDAKLEEFRADQDIDGQHRDGMAAMRDDKDVKRAIALLNNSEGDFKDSMFDLFNGLKGEDKRMAPFSLLAWDPQNKHLGNDTVGYYFLWDADMAWMGFNLEPPVQRLLAGQWEPLFINNKLKQIDHDAVMNPGRCSEFKTDVLAVRKQMQQSPNYMGWAASGSYTPFERLKSAWPELPYDEINQTYVRLMRNIVGQCGFDKDLLENLN